MEKIIYLNSFGQLLLTLVSDNSDPDFLHQEYYDITGRMIDQSEYEFDGKHHVIRILTESED